MLGCGLGWAGRWSGEEKDDWVVDAEGDYGDGDGARGASATVGQGGCGGEHNALDAVSYCLTQDSLVAHRSCE